MFKQRYLSARAAGRPSTTPGVPTRHTVGWPLWTGIIALLGLAVGAPMVSAEPALAPLTKEVEASVITAVDAVPAEAVPGSTPDGAGAIYRIAAVATVSTVHTASAVDLPDPVPAPAPTTTTTAPEPEPAPAPAPAPDPVPAPAPEPVPAAAPAPAVSDGGPWDQLAQCEAGGNWGIDTGNGYYGGLQFSLSSWQAVGGQGYPNQASRETQISMGERLRAAQGWGAWPACSRKLGLR